MIQIKDGEGSGYLAGVDTENRIRSMCTTQTESLYVNRTAAQMYTMSIGNLTVGVADNCIGYLKNDDSTRDLIIVAVRFRCSGGAAQLTYKLGDSGTPAAAAGGTPTVVTPVNRNAYSNNTASVTCYRDTGITGLSGGQVAGSTYNTADSVFEEHRPCSGYILPTNGVFTLYCNAAVTVWIGVGFYLLGNG